MAIGALIKKVIKKTKNSKPVGISGSPARPSGPPGKSAKTKIKKPSMKDVAGGKTNKADIAKENTLSVKKGGSVKKKRAKAMGGGMMKKRMKRGGRAK